MNHFAVNIENIILRNAPNLSEQEKDKIVTKFRETEKLLGALGAIGLQNNLANFIASYMSLIMSNISSDMSLVICSYCLSSMIISITPIPTSNTVITSRHWEALQHQFTFNTEWGCDQILEIFKTIDIKIAAEIASYSSTIGQISTVVSVAAGNALNNSFGHNFPRYVGGINLATSQLGMIIGGGIDDVIQLRTLKQEKNDLLQRLPNIINDELNGFDATLNKMSSHHDKLRFIGLCMYLVDNGWTPAFTYKININFPSDRFFTHVLKKYIDKYKPTDNNDFLSSGKRYLIHFYIRMQLFRLLFEVYKNHSHLVHPMWLKDAKQRLETEFHQLADKLKIVYQGYPVNTNADIGTAIERLKHEQLNYIHPMAFILTGLSSLFLYFIKSPSTETQLAISLFIILGLIYTKQLQNTPVLTEHHLRRGLYAQQKLHDKIFDPEIIKLYRVDDEEFNRMLNITSASTIDTIKHTPRIPSVPS